MKYKITQITFKDNQDNEITQRYVKTRTGFMHIPIKTGEITQIKDIVAMKTIGTIELDLPIEHVIIEQKEVEYQ